MHDGLRAELTRLRDIVEQVVAGEEQAHRARNAINELTMRQNNWTLGAYCAQYCRFVTGHHGLEDRSVFPHLRRSDPALTPVLDRLESEHLVIHDVLEQLDEALVGLVSGASGSDRAATRRRPALRDPARAPGLRGGRAGPGPRPARLRLITGSIRRGASLWRGFGVSLKTRWRRTRRQPNLRGIA